MAGIVERYLHAVASQDWRVVDDCITDDIVRVGPYGDRFVGRDDYLAYLADLMPKLAGYAMKLDRVTYAAELVFAELRETVEVDGKPTVTQEVLVFELGSDGRIAHVEIYIQTPAG